MRLTVYFETPFAAVVILIVFSTARECDLALFPLSRVILKGIL